MTLFLSRNRIGRIAHFAAASLMYMSDAMAHEFQPLPCTEAPERAAIMFFDAIEQPAGSRIVRDRAGEMFSRRFLKQNSVDSTVEFIELAKKRYNLSNVERSFNDRVEGYPSRRSRIDGGQAVQTSGDVSLWFLVLSGYGKIEQNIIMTCEDKFWKVVRFAYGADSASP
ncbi:hypothetical protein [Cupriavidus lacunae]|uniref:DUF4019 domain-containing protein n=1 Tax=Cupriavidus lacunae TaxID=2666307 RepID=A0A370MY31_9BURK|nr:hypothetical protein [Cupriavidus lacunae]RDJ98264.1 hypothetical protein DN412_41260 [Cupriavidus lacunae]